ncbi:MAG: PAS domain S-box protein [Myxococcales bacterium]
MSRQRFINRLLGGDQEREPVAVMVISSDGTLTWGNPAMHRMLGYAMGTLRGLRVVDVLPDHMEFLHAVFMGHPTPRIQTSLPKTDGRWVDVSLTAQPMNREAGEIGAVAILCRALPPWHIILEPKQAHSA